MSAQKTTDSSDKRESSIKEAIGQLAGDPKVEAEGRSQQQLPKSDVKPKTVPQA